MKRLFSMLAVAAVLAAMIGTHGVADEQEGHHRGKGKMGEMMQHEHPKQQIPLMHEMMRRMMQPEVVATADGGVVVLHKSWPPPAGLPGPQRGSAWIDADRGSGNNAVNVRLEYQRPQPHTVDAKQESN